MHSPRSCPSIPPPSIRLGTHLLTQRSVAIVADRGNAFSVAGRLLPISGAAYDAVAATNPMQQTAVVRLNQFARASCCIGFLLALSSCHQPTRTEKTHRDAPVEVMVPEHGAYTGAFIDFGEAEEDVTLEGIEDFETMVGKHQAI